MNQSDGTMLPFLIGATAGAAVALLFSPKSGPEMRASIGEGFDSLKETLTGAVGGRLEKAGVRVTAAGDSLQGLGARIQS